MRTVKIINLTTHPIDIKKGGLTLTIPPSGVVARCSQKTETIETVKDEISGILIPITQTVYGQVEGLPHKQKDTYYIVSKIVAEKFSKRKDLLIPNGVQVDSIGRTTGCLSLSLI